VSRRRVFVALGSNLGDRSGYLRRGREALAALPVTRLVAVSRLYQTAPQDLEDQPAFLNQVVCLETGLEPRELLSGLQTTEIEAGRERHERFGPRTLDLDILLVEDYHSDDPELTVPHPRLWQRAFALAPLADVWWLARGMPEADVAALAHSLAGEQAVEVYVETERHADGAFAEERAELRRLAAERNAVILAHNYQRAEVQDAADFVGDSLELARKAAATDAETILFCGVHFMAETAHILSPQKTVLMPDKRAGCPMANMVTPEALRALKAQHPDAAVVAYVNTSADVKAEVDVCCTSANAVEVVRRFPADQPLIFVPDRNLGDYVRRRLGRDMILWDGYCHVHDGMRAEQVLELKARFPAARVMAHPECRREVLDIADAVLSTSGMLRYPADEDATEYIVCTETGLLHRLDQLYPHKRFVAVSRGAVCPNMKLTTLDKAIVALRDGLNEVTVPPRIRERALRAVQRMVEG
jgi:quinolinate synthase